MYFQIRIQEKKPGGKNDNGKKPGLDHQFVQNNATLRMDSFRRTDCIGEGHITEVRKKKNGKNTNRKGIKLQISGHNNQTRQVQLLSTM